MENLRNLQLEIDDVSRNNREYEQMLEDQRIDMERLTASGDQLTKQRSQIKAELNSAHNDLVRFPHFIYILLPLIVLGSTGNTKTK